MRYAVVIICLGLAGCVATLGVGISNSPEPPSNEQPVVRHQ